MSRPDSKVKNKNRREPHIAEDVSADRREYVRRQKEIESSSARLPKDKVDIASMDSFPCSDPPGYYACHC